MLFPFSALRFSSSSALDSQLTEELPQFADAGENLLSRSLTGLLALELRFARRVLELLGDIDIKDRDRTSNIVEECQREQRNLMIGLFTMAVVPRSLAKEFDVSTPPAVASVTSVKRMMQKASLGSGAESAGGGGAATGAAAADDDDDSAGASIARSNNSSTRSASATPRVKVARPGPSLPRAVASYEFDATNDAELQVAAGEEVDVLAFEDLNGNSEWWQCRNAKGKEGEWNARGRDGKRECGM